MSSITVADAWTYEWGARKRPYVHPLHSPSGKVLTRNSPEDHPWHHGLWFTIKFVNEENFWEEVPPYGVLRHTAEPTVSAGGRDVDGELHWIRPDKTTVVIRERRRLTHVELDDSAYAIDFTTELRRSTTWSSTAPRSRPGVDTAASPSVARVTGPTRA